MFEYFPSNYGWSLSVACSLSAGAELAEVHEACKPLVHLADAPMTIANEAWYQSWMAVSQKLEKQGEELLKRGREISAGGRFYRACNYLLIAERLVDWSDARKVATYRQARPLFEKAVKLMGHRTERVEVPFEGATLAGYLRLPRGEGPFPVIIFFDGFDSIKELHYGWVGDAAVNRGVAVLFIDQDGTGEAMRLDNITKKIESEHAAAAFVDFLETHPEIDSARIGVAGVSNGGYDAPRAAAFEKRLKCVVCVGAFYDAEFKRQSVLDMIANPDVPRRGMNFASHLRKVTGKADVMEAFEAWAARTLSGILDRLTVPILVLHGQNDRQVPLKDAERTIAEVTNSPMAELKIFTIQEGSKEHCGVDLMSAHMEYAFDWVAEVMGGHTATASPAD